MLSCYSWLPGWLVRWQRLGRGHGHVFRPCVHMCRWCMRMRVLAQVLWLLVLVLLLVLILLLLLILVRHLPAASMSVLISQRAAQGCCGSCTRTGAQWRCYRQCVVVMGPRGELGVGGESPGHRSHASPDRDASGCMELQGALGLGFRTRAWCRSWLQPRQPPLSPGQYHPQGAPLNRSSCGVPLGLRVRARPPFPIGFSITGSLEGTLEGT